MSFHLTPAARTALRCYRGLARRTRTHVLLRWVTAPLAAVEAALPRTGQILEVGCGHGLLSLVLAAAESGREVHGIDIDVAKIHQANQAAAALEQDGRVSFAAVPSDWRPPASQTWDAVVICDVLYLLGAAAALDLVRACAASLRPGGMLVIKEIDTRPSWKYRLSRAQELAATRLAKITQGEVVRFVAIEELTATMEAAGLRTTRQQLDRGYPHPHLLLTGRLP